MKKKSKSKGKAVEVKPEAYLSGFMAKLLDHMVALEKKMDVLLVQISAKSHDNKPQAPAFQRPNPPQHQNNPTHNQNQHRDRTLYEAICADCRKVCEVPFRPTEERPVYCKECFAKRRMGLTNKPQFAPPVLKPAVAATPPPSKAPSAVKAGKKKKPAKKGKR